MKPKYNHKEAFCLMQYKCPACGTTETLWNSRDGVTPFMIPCAVCGSHEMSHVHFYNDHWAPNHVPAVGSRIFADMTTERARTLAEKAINRILIARPGFLQERQKSRQVMIDDTAADFYGRGDSPDIVTVAEANGMPLPKQEYEPKFKQGTFISQKEPTSKVFLVKGVCVVRGVEGKHYLMSIKQSGVEIVEAVPVSEVDDAGYFCCGGVFPNPRYYPFHSLGAQNDQQRQLEEQLVTLQSELSLLDDKYKCNTAIMHARTKALSSASEKLNQEKDRSSKLKSRLSKATKACRSAKQVLDRLPRGSAPPIVPQGIDEVLDRAIRQITAVCTGVFDRDCDPAGVVEVPK